MSHMKKIVLTIFTLAAVFSGTGLQAQTTGGTAVATAKTAKSNHWQNWTFAATAVATATGAILAVSLQNGDASSSH
jgi:hypothetical protein